MATVRFYGDQELLNKLEKANIDVVEACAAALQESMDLLSVKLLAAWNSLPKKNPTGKTARSIMTNLVIDGDVIKARCGFSAKSGGLPAQFWNVGTDYIRATHFIDDVAEEAIDDVRKTQLDVLKGILD